MARQSRLIIGVCASLAVLPALAGPAGAAGTVMVPGAVMQQNEMQMLQDRIQRQQYQQNQQIIRELDRQATPSRPLREQVPVMKPNCQVQVFGNSYGGTACR
ncbi:hypothetical protein ATER59S_03151 [Aquamicrobium terrae]|uniref:hypothetical protein n=1 Tax=Mesorhizobium sp. PUT5 TaxID=3454629 RepID=UPI003FA484BA